MFHRCSPLFIATAVILVSLVSACSSNGPAREIPTPGPAEPTPVPRAVSIPADERSHDERLEWWYYNGHLEDEAGREFGFHFVIFQTRGDNGKPAYAAQFAVTDVRAGEHRLDSRLFAGDAGVVTPAGFQLQVSGWSLDIEATSHSIRATTDDGVSLEITLGIARPGNPVLHSEDGWFATPAGWSYYYSWPNMPATGELTIDGEVFPVTGAGWFDHQWGDFFALGAPAGWQWMGLQLGGGETLMVTETRASDGSIDAVFGTWSDGRGTVRSLDAGDGIDIQVLDTWTSPDTGAEYPSGWRLKIASIGLDVEIAPVVADQEVDEGIPRAAIYWEGKVEIAGTYRGERIEQPGYIELTGYVEPEPIPWRTAD